MDERVFAIFELKFRVDVFFNTLGPEPPRHQFSENIVIFIFFNTNRYIDWNSISVGFCENLRWDVFQDIETVARFFNFLWLS